MQQSEQPRTGRVVYWQDVKGFGFLFCQQSQQKLFFHIRDFVTKSARPKLGDEVQFCLGTDKRGRPIAIQLQFTEADKQQPQPNKTSQSIDLGYAEDVSLYFRSGFLMLLVIALLFGSLPFVLPILYLEASLFTYWLYQQDKAAAISGQVQRLPEESLQLYSLIGGWPGALLAQKKLAHKRRKFRFQREFWLVVLGNALLIAWLLSQHGQEFIGRLALFGS
ncbi:cold shock and DUF1294 domain-containing protein [Alkalimonas mucilaginosa]|uniref:Cold shock and DUF1294 domain-containing protein n=1 Tax=Alkalimonas mucilaginosa TaxID=3057676 RepID=A0ABU7JBV6_9GAMM|nr:cold shock and DUF1294 domain-containing protein [Alkalimonas sp. MEB004]MEE2023164.1 cold shock and DUF1294 domain-containing protein [Alkalimonas sp. MEB004]